MGCNINPIEIDNITEGNYYQILHTDTLRRFKGLPFLVHSVHLPFILTDIGILDLREIDLIKVSDDFIKAWKNKSDNFAVPPICPDSMMISPFSS